MQWQQRDERRAFVVGRYQVGTDASEIARALPHYLRQQIKKVNTWLLAALQIILWFDLARISIHVLICVATQKRFYKFNQLNLI